MTAGHPQGENSAASGVAEVTGIADKSGIQFTVIPGTASGTGSVEVVPDMGTAYEAVYDKDGNALTIDLSAQISHRLPVSCKSIKITSDNPADTYSLKVVGLGAGE